MVKRLIPLLLIISGSLHALQKIEVQTGQTVNAYIAKEELSHLSVVNDRISGLSGATSSMLSYEADNKLGSLMINPRAAQGEAFHVFLTTENGKTISVKFHPIRKNPETIQFHFKEPLMTGKQFALSTEYEQNITTLIKAMYQRGAMQGFEIEKIAGRAKHTKGVSEQQIARYQGQDIVGEIIQVKNNSQETYYLNEALFAQPGTRAICIPRRELSPNQTTFVYRIADNA